MIHEFNDPIEVDTPLGRGRAFFVQGSGHDYYWTVALNDTKAFVTFTQDRLRATSSYTHRRGIDDTAMRVIIR